MTTTSLLPDVGTELREGYAEVGDQSLHYVEAGDGPLIVLLHGFPEFWFGWRLQIAPLAAAGFRVVAPDTRGYNLSSKPEGFEDYAVDLLAAAYGDLTGASVLVLGAAYRGGVKETAFSGVFPTVSALNARGATTYVSDPMYTAAELTSLGLTPHENQTVTAAVVQADHAEYRTLRSADLPSVRVLVDGRRITDPTLWRGVHRVLIGG